MGLFSDVTPEQMEFGAGDGWYPLGEYAFAIVGANVAEGSGDQNGNPFDGFETTDTETLFVQLAYFEPLNGGSEPPSELVRQSIKIPIRDGDTSLFDVTVPKKGTRAESHASLVKGRRRLAQLAAEVDADRISGSDTQFVADLQTDEYRNANNSEDLRLSAEFAKWSNGDRTGSYITKFL